MKAELKKIGFTMGDLAQLIWLRQTVKEKRNPKELHDIYKDLFPTKPLSYDYIARLGKKLSHQGLLHLEQEQHKKYYRCTDKGIEVYKQYENLYYGRLNEITFVVNRIYAHLRNEATIPPIHPLPGEFRNYFSKLISVKDIVREMIFELGENKPVFYIAEAGIKMGELYGWEPSNAYLYEISRDMEAEGTLKGRWKDEEKRTIRLVQVTEDGRVFAKQVRQALYEQVEGIKYYLDTIIKLLD